jgi:hypothetical protein
MEDMWVRDSSFLYAIEQNSTFNTSWLCEIMARLNVALVISHHEYRTDM